MNGTLAAALVAAISLSCPAVAHAQTTQPPAGPPTPSAAEIAKTLGDTPTSPTKPWQPFQRDGIALTLTYTGEAATNLTGGLQRDAAYAGQIFAGVDADLGHIAGIEGATLHIAVTNRHGKSLSAIAIGNNTSVQEIYGTQNTHLALLTWQQRLFEGRLEFEVGRSVSNVAFTTSPLYCAFQSNAICGNPVFVYFASNSSGFPASRWSAHATVRPWRNLYFHAGAYEVNPDRGARGEHGLNFGLRNATGVYVPWEVGYEVGDRRLPGHYQVGGWFDRSRYSDPLRDEDGGIALQSGRPGAQRFGRTGLYVRFDQTLTRPDPHSDRGVSVFGVAMVSVEGQVPSNQFLVAGLLKTGTLKSRYQDTIGMVVTDQRLSDLSLTRLAIGQALVGGSDQIRRHQIMGEINYGLQLNRALRIMPNVQYVINPDQLAAPISRRLSCDALVFGLRLSVDALSFASSAKKY